MGVTQLWQILAPVEQHQALSLLEGQTLAVDLSIWVCETQSVKQMQGVVSKPFLRNIFFRILHLTQLGVKLVFVIEGTAPELKWDTMMKRQQSRFPGRQAKAPAQKPAGKQSRRNFNTCLNECCELLEILGIPYIQSKGEAEAMCALLNLAGLVDGCLTNDGDAFLYGATTVYKNFTMNVKDPHVEMYRMSDIEAKLGLDRGGLVALGLLIGCDFVPKGVPGIGVANAVRLLQTLHGRDVIDRLREWRGMSDADCLDQIETMARRKSMCVLDFPQVKVIDEFMIARDRCPSRLSPWKRPVLAKLQEFALVKMEWPVEYTLDKILPLLTLWDMQDILQSRNPSRHQHLKPHRIVKTRVRQGEPCFEVEWHKPVTETQTEDNYYVTIESQDIFNKCYPNIVRSFNTMAAEPKKRKGKKKKEKTASVPSLDNLSFSFDKMNLAEVSSNLRESAKYLSPEYSDYHEASLVKKSKQAKHLTVSSLAGKAPSKTTGSGKVTGSGSSNATSSGKGANKATTSGRSVSVSGKIENVRMKEKQKVDGFLMESSSSNVQTESTSSMMAGAFAYGACANGYKTSAGANDESENSLAMKPVSTNANPEVNDAYIPLSERVRLRLQNKEAERAKSISGLNLNSEFPTKSLSQAALPSQSLTQATGSNPTHTLSQETERTKSLSGLNPMHKASTALKPSLKHATGSNPILKPASNKTAAKLSNQLNRDDVSSLLVEVDNLSLSETAEAHSNQCITSTPNVNTRFPIKMTPQLMPVKPKTSITNMDIDRNYSTSTGGATTPLAALDSFSSSYLKQSVMDQSVDTLGETKSCTATDVNANNESLLHDTSSASVIDISDHINSPSPERMADSSSFCDTKESGQNHNNSTAEYLFRKIESGIKGVGKFSDFDNETFSFFSDKKTTGDSAAKLIPAASPCTAKQGSVTDVNALLKPPVAGNVDSKSHKSASMSTSTPRTATTTPQHLNMSKSLLDNLSALNLDQLDSSNQSQLGDFNLQSSLLNSMCASLIQALTPKGVTMTKKEYENLISTLNELEEAQSDDDGMEGPITAMQETENGAALSFQNRNDNLACDIDFSAIENASSNLRKLKPGVTMEPIRLLGSSDALSVDQSGAMSKTARKKLRRKERKKALEDIACLNNMSLNMMNTVSDHGDACSQKKADGINEEAKLKNDITEQRKVEKGKAAQARPETCKTEKAQTSANKNSSSKVHCKENKAVTVNGENEHCTRSKTGLTNGDTRHIKNGHSKSGKKDKGCENRNMVADQAGCNPGKGNPGGNKGDGKGKQGCERKKENLVKTRTSQASENGQSTVKNETQKSQEMGKKGKKDKNSSKLSEHVSFIHEKTANGENMKMKPNQKQLSSDCISGVVNGKASMFEIDKQFNPNNGENSKQFKPNGKQFSSGSNFEASSAKSKPSATAADTVMAALKLPSSLTVSGLNVNSEPGTGGINSGSLVPGSCTIDDQESEATTKRKKKKKRVKKSSSLSDGKIDIGRTNLCSEYLKNALVSQHTKKSSAITGIRKASAIFDISADDTLLELDGLTSHLTQEQMEPQAIKKMMLLKQRKKLSLEKVKLQTETQLQMENIVEFEQMENGIEVNDGEINQNEVEVNDDSESQKNHIDNGDKHVETQQMANALENDCRGTVGINEQHLETDSGSSSEPNQANGINGAMFKAEGSAKAKAESESVESETITVDSSDDMEVIAEDEPVSCTAARAAVSLPLFEAILGADEVVNANLDSDDASDENLDSNKDKENIDSDEAIPDLDNVDDDANLDSDDVVEGNLDSDDSGDVNLESDEAILDSDDIDDVIIVEDEEMDRKGEEGEGLFENGVEVNGDTDNLVSHQEKESVFQVGTEINNDVDRNGEEGLEDESLLENGTETHEDTRNDVGHNEDEHVFDNDVEVNEDTNSEVSQVEDECVIENGKEREDQDFNNTENDFANDSVFENKGSSFKIKESSYTGIGKVWEQNHCPTSFTSQVQQHSEVQQRHDIQTTNGIVDNGNREVSSVYDIAENGIYAVSNGCHQTRSTYSGEEQLEDIRNGNHPNSLVNLGQNSSHHGDEDRYEVNCDAVLDDSQELLVDSSDCIIVEHGKDSVVHEIGTSFNGISSVEHDIDNSLNGNSLIDHAIDNSFNNTDCDTSKVPNTVNENINENINPNSEDIVAKCGSSSNSTNAFDAFDGANAASTTSDNHAEHMHSDIVTQSPACLADRLKLKLRKKSTRNVLETFTNGKFAS